MNKTLADLHGMIHQHNLDRFEAKILALAKPAIAIEQNTVKEKTEIPIGGSKLGGSPDLPAGFAWPYLYRKPLAFIAQFNLSEVTHFDTAHILPERGMLYFFCDVDELDGWSG